MTSVVPGPANPPLPPIGRGVRGGLIALHLGGGAALCALGLVARGQERAVASAFTAAGWAATFAALPTLALVERCRRHGLAMRTLTLAWLGSNLAVAGIAAALWLAWLAGREPAAQAVWGRGSFGALVCVALGSALFGVGLRRSSPAAPTDLATLGNEVWVRLPTQLVVVGTIVWAAAVWLRLRPESDGPYLFATGVGALLARRLVAPQAHLRALPAKLTALAVLTLAAVAAAGAAGLLRRLAREDGASLPLALVLLATAATIAATLPRQSGGARPSPGPAIPRIATAVPVPVPAPVARSRPGDFHEEP